MNTTISVKSGITPTAHSSFEQAAAASKKDIANYDNIKGKTVSGISYGSNKLFIEFEGTDMIASISIGDNCIDCTISKENKNIGSEPELNIPEIIRLDFSGTVVDWNRTVFFENIIGKVIALAPSEQYLFVYVKGVADYMCSYLVDKNQNYKPFLYLSEY